MRWLNWLNRGVAIFSLALIAVVFLVIGLVPGFSAFQIRALADLLDVSPFTGGHLSVAIVSLPIAIVAAALLVLELRLRTPGLVALDGAGGAHLTADSLILQLRRDVMSVVDVHDAQAKVRPRRKSVDIDLRVTTSTNVDVPRMAAEVTEVARASIERLGIKLGKLSVQLRQSERVSSSRGETPPSLPAKAEDDPTTVEGVVVTPQREAG